MINLEAFLIFLIFLSTTALFPAFIVPDVEGPNNEAFKGNGIIDYSAKWPRNNLYFLNCVDKLLPVISINVSFLMSN